MAGQILLSLEQPGLAERADVVNGPRFIESASI